MARSRTNAVWPEGVGLRVVPERAVSWAAAGHHAAENTRSVVEVACVVVVGCASCCRFNARVRFADLRIFVVQCFRDW
jgi:hypothetical protein